MDVNGYDLCETCKHTPAFCYCSDTGRSRAEDRRQQEIVVKEIFDSDEFQWGLLREMAKQMLDEPDDRTIRKTKLLKKMKEEGA